MPAFKLDDEDELGQMICVHAITAGFEGGQDPFTCHEDFHFD